MKRGPKPRPPEDRLVSVTVKLSPPTYDTFCKAALEKQQSLSAILRAVLTKSLSKHP